VCPHTCNTDGCPSRKTGILWPKEGSSLLRHIKTTKHPNCTESCPAYGNTKVPPRTPTSQEIEENISTNPTKRRLSRTASCDKMDIDEDEPFSQPVASSSSSFHPPSSTYTDSPHLEALDFDDTPIPPVSLENNNNTLNLVYVSDPTRYLTRSSSENDVSWIKAVLSAEEIEMLGDLSSRAFHAVNQRGRKRTPSTMTVLIQEWVSAFST